MPQTNANPPPFFSSKIFQIGAAGKAFFSYIGFMDSSTTCSGCNLRHQKIAELQDQSQNSQAEIDRLKSQNEKLKTENEKLKAENKKLKQPLNNNNQPASPLDNSLDNEAKRQAKKNKKLSKKQQRKQAGRKSTQEKWKAIDPKNIRHIYPELPPGVTEKDCKVAYQQVVTHIIENKAVLYGYIVYKYKKKKGVIPGVLGRSEFGIEIVIQAAYLIFQNHNSFGQVIRTVAFFQQLHLTKSQIESLINQLQFYWEPEFERLAVLLANSAIVYADETSWSLKSVWVLLSEQARLILFGVNKDGDTLQKILDKAIFAGILISDNAKVYDGFTRAQKCWAHLLRKAIEMALRNPGIEKLQVFKDELFDLYRKAKRIKSDGRLSDAGRAKKVKELDDELTVLCQETYAQDKPSGGWQKKHWLLVEEIITIADKGELFTFVTAADAQQPNGGMKPVEGTNNEPERTNIPIAEDRKNKKTSKSYGGCRRKSVITSVLESLKLYLPSFTLESVLKEVLRWQKTGRSCFERWMRKRRLKMPKSEDRLLDRVIPESRVAV